MKSGAAIGQRFELECEIGAGGMARVFRARDTQTGAIVAVKIIRRDTLADAVETTARLAREARILAELSHPAVVRYLEHGVTDEGEPYLVIEWLDGETCASASREKG